MLGFYCRASIVYNIMLLTLILTPSFSSPILEENAVGVRNDTFTCTATSSRLLNRKFKSVNLNPSPTLLSKQFCDSSRHLCCSSIACLALNLETELADLASLCCLQNWPFHLDCEPPTWENRPVGFQLPLNMVATLSNHGNFPKFIK